MGSVIGEVLPLAIGVAVSPVPVIAVILMLLSPRASGASAGFLAGWTAGIVAVTTIALLLADGATGPGDGPSRALGVVELALGALLLALAVRQWRARPAPGVDAPVPGWMAGVESSTPVRAVGAGLLLSAVNPKNLALCVAAGAAIGEAGLSVGGDAVVVAVHAVVAASSVALPVVAYAVARQRMRGPLDELRAWLQRENAAVMAVLLLVLGVHLLGKGIGSL